MSSATSSSSSSSSSSSTSSSSLETTTSADGALLLAEHQRLECKLADAAAKRAGKPRLPTVVLLKRQNNEVVQDCDVYIGRACFRGGWRLKQSKWHNPISVKKAGSAKAAVKAFDKYIRAKPELLDAIPELYGKRLGCWCKRTIANECHGDVLVALARERIQRDYADATSTSSSTESKHKVDERE